MKSVAAGVAASHPATARAGLRILESGGTAADAAVAAVLACCVAETVYTGLGGGGFATFYDARTREVTCLDFFVAVPGLDGDRDASAMVSVDVFFGGLAQIYSIGGASVAVPGVPAGLGEVHRRWGRLPWPEVVAPAAGLARTGVLLPDAHARTLESCAPALAYGEGAAWYQPGGRLLQGDELLYHPGLATTMDVLASDGPEIFYTGGTGSCSSTRYGRQAGRSGRSTWPRTGSSRFRWSRRHSPGIGCTLGTISTGPWTRSERCPLICRGPPVRRGWRRPWSTGVSSGSGTPRTSPWWTRRATRA
ncbi:gamma-glutamyltransferase [Actinoplanes sp. CA-252034]|uniref:gamma-glutamyltransferase n=1 Tax=Actinoplanes sp. CA-252034 TaxID=3239906 RepID=UPI003D97086E